MLTLDRNINLGLVGTNASATYYFTAPYRCKVLTVLATAQNSDIGDADTATVKDAAGNTIGVATFGSDIAAGAKATYVKNATYGDEILAEGEVGSVTVSALDAAGDRIHLVVVLDPYCISA